MADLGINYIPDSNEKHLLIGSPISWDVSINPTRQFYSFDTINQGDRSTWIDYQGNIKDDANQNAARTVRLYDRATGKLLNSTTSNSSGNYSILSPINTEVQIVALDDYAGSFLNDLIKRAIP